MSLLLFFHISHLTHFTFLNMRGGSNNISDNSDQNKDGTGLLKVLNKNPSGSKEMDDVFSEPQTNQQQSVKEKIVHNTIWKTAVLICELILLFGFEIRDLFCPADSDVGFDVIFMLSFVLLLVDIILMCMALPGYFEYGFSDQHGFRIIFGSWPFWLDFLSALTLLNEITFINRIRLRSEEYNILISANDDGTVSGLKESIVRCMDRCHGVRILIHILLFISFLFNTDCCTRYIPQQSALRLFGFQLGGECCSYA